MIHCTIHILSLVYSWWQILFAISCWFKVNYCLPIPSSDRLVYYWLPRNQNNGSEWSDMSTRMYQVQDYEWTFISTMLLTQLFVRGRIFYAHVEIFSWPHHFTMVGSFSLVELVKTRHLYWRACAKPCIWVVYGVLEESNLPVSTVYD